MPVDFLSALHHLASHNLRRDPSIASIEARHSGTAQGNISSGPRRIHVNVPLPKDHVDARGNPLRSWTTNKVKTSKYSLLTFLPKNLFEQFRRLANFFFLTITIIQFFPDFQQIEPIVAALPLIIIVFLTAVKDGIEDWRRHVSDSQLNGKLVYTLRGGNWRNVNVEEYSDTGWGARLRATFVTGTTWVLGAVVQSATMMWNWATKLTAHSESGDSGRPSESGSRSPPSSPSPGSRKPTLAFLPPTPTNLDTPHFLQVSWRSLLPGDIILLRGNEDVPCDVLALASSDESGVVYVETKNLDGETNLKIRRCMGETAHLRPDERGMSSLRTCKFWVETEPPNESVHNFNGAMVWCVDKETPTAMEQSATGQHHDPKTRLPISMSNLLLRGCAVRNTQWVLCLVLFTGEETRVRLNAGPTRSKRSRVEIRMNQHIAVNLALILFMCLWCTIGLLQTSSWVSWDWVVPDAGGASWGWYGFVTFLNGLIQFQNILPMPLYLTVEIVKSFQAFFIHQDREMYYEDGERSVGCTPKSWNLGDDLGQIEYIFSDKTGTLTRNVMDFKRCSINGYAYTGGTLGTDGASVKKSPRVSHGLRPQEQHEVLHFTILFLRLLLLHHLRLFITPPILSLLARGYSENFVGNQEWMIQAKRMKEFFTVLAVCHSVVPSQVVKVVRELRYRAQSPDEAALVDAAKNLGIAFLGRKVNTVILDVFGKQEQYEILNVLEFNSTRKRMSVVVRRPDGVLSLFCKGADSVVMGRMATGQKEIVDVTSMHLDAFAEEGLRTLCLATVELTEKGYKDWEREHQEASASIIDRESKVDSVAEKLEQNLILLGATAIEDKLQEGVPETISTLSKAGIKIWVLTGDKMETAINIAFSCNLLDKEMTLIMIRGPSGSGAEDIQNETRPIRQQVASALATYFTKPARSWFGRSDSQCDPPQKRALIIDGYALKHALEPKTKAMLLELACRCTAVVCCRVSPLQKAEVVRLVKDSKGVMCLAIGDGANDVSMIQAAQVGVGIAGEEGLQAAMSSDYAIAQFRYLTRLLLVHGRWNYWRTGEMIFNFFFKNIIWTLPTFWFQIYCAYSSGINIEYTYLMFYQTLFTALSPIAIGIFDKDIDSIYALAVPQIYGSGVRGEVYTNGRFLLYCVQGLYQSVVVFFVPIYVYDEGPDHPRGYAADGFLVGACVAITAIVNANAYMLYGCHSWTYIIHGVFLLHVGIVYLYAGIFSLDPNTQTYGAYELGYGSLKFWLTFAICTALCQLPRVMYLYIMRNYMPTDVNIVAELQKMCKPVDLATGVSRSGTKRSVWDLDVEAVQESGNQHLGTPLDIDFLRRQMSQPSPPGGVSPSSKRTSSDQNHSPSSDETSTSMSPSSILAPTPRKIRDMRTEEGYLHDRGFSFAHDKGTTAIIMGTPTLLKKIISECEIAEDGGTNDKSQQMRHRKRGHKRHASEKMKDPSMNQNESSLTSKGSSQPERSEDGAQRQVVPRLKSAPPARLGARAKADGVARTTGDLLNIS
ncbi:phospholipid-translocating P-type ATPase [Gonapodya prolifera JEL478]|uniref:Phospholipid-transporting ATPase n=1 Tax=Gonapodya prolifera (strain JEL478) TaxID=1344416 RepID=A0A139AIE8_GONPJ|nr:phospholipid-translocating P-type ATPase [Gonapodya prolifera JEL478]|eukprot:KXS16560.1 phospholipid-translocating P-type ATPase [Gonapodya prolifera JEL478]